MTTPILATALNDLGPLHRTAVGFLARYTNSSTYDLYKRYLGDFFTWCAQNQIDPLAAERTHIELYVRHLVKAGYATGSVCAAMSPVRGFYKLAAFDDVVRKDPCTMVRLPKVAYTPEPLFDRDDIRRLVRAGRDLSVRHHALVLVLATMGMRVSEVCAIDVPDIYNTEQGYRVVRYVGKGNKPSWVVIPYQVIGVLEQLADDRREGPLFTNLDGDTRMTRSGAYGLLSTVAKHAGFAKGRVHPHLLKKAAITLLLDMGVDLPKVQEFGHHEDPAVTLRVYNLNKQNFGESASHLVAARVAS